MGEEALGRLAAALVELSVWWACQETYRALRCGYLSQAQVLERASPRFQLGSALAQLSPNTRSLCMVSSLVLGLQGL